MKTRTALLTGALALVVAACSAGATPTAPSSNLPASPPPTAAPDEPVVGEPGGLFPLPGDGAPTNVNPAPGQRNVHPVNVELIEARVNGDRVAVRLTWTSGVAPCYALDSVLVARDRDTVWLTVREGSGPEDVACIEIALRKSTIVDLGALAPGTYTIATADGPAIPIGVTIP